MSYELVDLEVQRGLLRILIEHHPNAETGITLEDCEQVSRQLSYLLTVENIEFSRLEISSPGLDRPLKKIEDFHRFVGKLVSIRLRQPTNSLDNRKNFEGTLLPSDGDILQLQYPDAKNAKELLVLRFQFMDVEKARLIPQINFRGKKV